MKLIYKQVENIQEEIARISRKREIYDIYLSQARSEPLENANGYKLRDSNTEAQMTRDQERIKELRSILTTAEIIDTPSDATIGIGTSFTAHINGEDEELTLVENMVCLTASDGYISIESPLGKSVLGKEVGEEFTYSVKLSPYEIHQISGKVESIGRRELPKIKAKM